MSDFTQYTKSELVDIAGEFAVEVNPASTKAEIIARLAEDGVTHDLYKSMHPDVTDEEEVDELLVQPVEVTTPTAPVAKTLLKMTRKNGSFEVRGVRFTRENPFALVPDEDVDYIIDVVGGFEVARATEVAKYYA